MTDSEPQKGRGRPRVPEDERKRHTLTFRMRGDLREAVEELAKLNGRTLSEQVELYVDAAAFSEAELVKHQSRFAISPTLQRYISNVSTNKEGKKKANMTIGSKPDHLVMPALTESNCSDRTHAPGLLSWAQEPGGRRGAVAMARTMLNATRAAAINALTATVGSEAVEAVLAEEAQARQFMPSQPHHTTMKQNMLVNQHTVTSAQTQTNFEQRHAVSGQTAQGFSDSHDFSLVSLKSHLQRIANSSPNLPTLLSPWPRKFSQLPGNTRAALIKVLKDDAESTYETMMRAAYPPGLAHQPERPAGQGMAPAAQRAALVRLQRALRSGQDEDDADQGE